ncbi:1-aminocyclopropane-1-carboxylate deaminase/D-cysteine desulfhydrase [Myroides sp. LJL115]
MDLFENDLVLNQKVNFDFGHGIDLYIKREDLLHKEVSGNKFRKLKYNLIKARELGIDTVLTFGGAFSNHIFSTAAACSLLGLKSIGVIRGEEIASKFLGNPTLSKAFDYGMQFKFVSREDYRKKTQTDFIEQLQEEFGCFYLVPEGGTNSLAILGTQEILKPKDMEFDYICSAVGTGGTIAGLIQSSGIHQSVVGYPALKGDFLKNEIAQWTNKENWHLVDSYHFGGYAKVDSVLLEFIEEFNRQFGILLDPIYTGKMLYGIFQDIEKGHFKDNSKILAIHTGGLQGWNSKIKGFKKL